MQSIFTEYLASNVITLFVIMKPKSKEHSGAIITFVMNYSMI